MWSCCKILLLWMAFAPILIAPATAQGKRLALVIGVSDYDKPSIADVPALSNLANARHDAQEIAAILKDILKFDVTLRMTRNDGQDAETSIAVIRAAWAKLLADAKKDDIVLFYYAGHGVEAAGRNFLLARDSKIDLTDVGPLRESALDLQDMMHRYGAKQATTGGLGVFIIDACRDNPFFVQAKGAKVSGPIGPVQPPKQVFVMYSAGIGQKALDGSAGAKNSVYTKHLMMQLALHGTKKELSLADLAQDVRLKVYEEAARLKHDQTPAYYDQMTANYNMLHGKITPPGRLDLSQAKTRNPKLDIGLIRDLAPKSVLIECKYCPELVIMPEATEGFIMGDPEVGSGRSSELPQHKASIPRKFAIGRYEVTKREWDQCALEKKCPGNPRADGRNRNLEQLPVATVSWEEAVGYTSWLSEVTNAKYRLPTEAEWEYAARGGEEKPTKYSFHLPLTINDDGPDQDTDTARNLCGYANGADRQVGSLFGINLACDDNVGRRTAQVGSFKPNAFGLHDMLGNVWEWTLDCWHPSHPVTPAQGQIVMLRDGSKARETPGCARRVVRGGSWRSGPDTLRVSARNAFAASHRRPTVGFRVVREIE